MVVRRRSQPPLRDVGEDPDYRFTLANERTFLAWIRTALALMAAGVAVVSLLPGLGVAGARHIVGLLLIGLGGAIAAGSVRHWDRNERAMRMGVQLPGSMLPRVLAAALAIVAVAAFVLVAMEWRRL